MQRFLFLTAVLVITAALFAQTPAPSDSKSDQELQSVSCTVSGRVVTAAEGGPLKSAGVALIAEESGDRHSQIYATRSDSDGHFTLKDVPPGRYYFVATHAGFVERQYKAGSSDTAPLFLLRPGEKINDVLFRLTATAVIMGRVSNEDGEAMQQVQVIVLRRSSEEESEDDNDIFGVRKAQMEIVALGLSDDRGQYRIFGLNPGEYYIRADDSFQPRSGIEANGEGANFVIEETLGRDADFAYYPGVTQISQAQAVPIKPGEEVQADVIVRRVKTVEVRGNVIGRAGPVARASVRLEPAASDSDFMGDSDFSRDDTTDEKGSFRLRNVPQGVYHILASQRDESGGITLRGRQKVEVTGDNIDSLTIPLGIGTTIQGRIRVDGANSLALDRKRLSLFLFDADGQWSGELNNVKQDGSFEIKAVPDGEYAIQVSGLDHNAYIKSARSSHDDLLEKGLKVEGSTPGKLEVIVSSDVAQLEGSVADEDGAVIEAKVRLAPDPWTPYNRSRVHRTTTDQLGHFSLTDVPPGKYTLTARPTGASESTAYKTEPQSITLSEHDHKVSRIRLEKRQE